MLPPSLAVILIFHYNLNLYFFFVLSRYQIFTAVACFINFYLFIISSVNMQLYFLCKTCKIGTYVLEVIEKCTDQNLGGGWVTTPGIILWDPYSNVWLPLWKNCSKLCAKGHGKLMRWIILHIICYILFRFFVDSKQALWGLS